MGHKRRYEEFIGSMKSLLETGKHSDFIISCGEDTYNVHKSIVCSQCEFFDAASRFGKEGEEGKVDLVDDEPEIVKHLVNYLYEVDYHVRSEEVDGPWVFRMNWDFEKAPKYTPRRRIILDCSLWATSAMKMVEILELHPDIIKKQKVSSRVIELHPMKTEHKLIIKTLVKYWKELQAQNAEAIGAIPKPTGTEDPITHAKVYALAEKYNLKGLKDLAREKFTASLEHTFPGLEFFNAVDVVFTSTPDNDHGLRKVVAFHLSQQKEMYGMYGRLEHALKSTPSLAFHMIWCEYVSLEESTLRDASDETLNDSMTSNLP
ncbi:hypothetical protein EJ02DRAFT_501833 [Clathrospora elynae]|uniref:BTB domain-containing protein n=1 Tax=Clathrospora elynae TaxID=706981 RepID=A0A6A5SZ97_9PLEO|nr:hypothetical protein EJ02DRAFT_501833 [Clathrospora elynae]